MPGNLLLTDGRSFGLAALEKIFPGSLLLTEARSMGTVQAVQFGMTFPLKMRPGNNSLFGVFSPWKTQPGYKTDNDRHSTSTRTCSLNVGNATYKGRRFSQTSQSSSSLSQICSDSASEYCNMCSSPMQLSMSELDCSDASST